MAWQYGVAQTVAVTFYSAGEPTAPTGALSATISKDGGAFASISGTVTQIGATACALLSLAIADTTCDAGVVKITDAGGTADDRYVEFTTENNYTATIAGYIDAAISSRSTLTAAQVWAEIAAEPGTALLAFGATPPYTEIASLDLAEKNVDDLYNGCCLVVTSGDATGNVQIITDSDVTVDPGPPPEYGWTLTLSPGLPDGFSSDDEFIIVPIRADVMRGTDNAALATTLDTVAAGVLRVLGLVQENQYIDNVVTDSRLRMTSARLRTYSVAGSVGTTSDVIATYTITATYTGTEETPTTYKVVKA